MAAADDVREHRQEPTVTPSDGSALFFLTNQLNIQHVLSNRLLVPRCGFGKYYADLLEVVPDGIPLLPAPFPLELIAAVTSEEGAGFPVALETQVDAAIVRAAEIRATGGRLVGGVLPDATFRAIHFRNDRDREEFSSHRYANVPVDDHVLEVSPDLFGSTVGVDWLEALRASTVSTREPLTAEELVSEDRRAGGLLGVAMTADPEEAALGWLVTLLSGKSVLQRGEGPFWLSGTGSGLEAELFQAIVELLKDVDPLQEWRPREILDRLATRFKSIKVNASRVPIAQYVDRIRKILSNDESFEAFKPGGISVLKALLLVLMRWQLDRQISWPADQTGADRNVRMTAGYLSGFLTRRSRLPLDLRPAAMDRYLAYEEARRLNAARDVHLPPQSGPLTVRRARIDCGTLFTLVSDATVLMERIRPPRSVIEALRDVDLAEPSYREVALRLATVMGWHDAFRTTVRLKSPFEVHTRKEGVAEIRVNGSVELSEELVEESFNGRLRDTESLPDDLEQELQSLLPED